MRETLGTSGKAIWDSYDAGKLNAGHRALVLEFARCSDTADRLDELAKGRREVWFSLAFDDMGEVHLGVDKILDQVRANQTVLRGLHAEIRQANIEVKEHKQGSGTTRKDEEPDDMITKRRREKQDRERKLG